MNSSLGLPLVLQLFGVLVVIAEIVIPSGGLLSIVALGLFGYSIFLVFEEVSAATGLIFLVADIFLIPIMVIVGLRLLARSPATLRKKLSREDGVVSQDPELDMYLGREGTASSDLRPAGMALIDGKRVDVVSQGDYIAQGAPIVVTAVTGNQIIVKAKEDPQGG